MILFIDKGKRFFMSEFILMNMKINIYFFISVINNLDFRKEALVLRSSSLYFPVRNKLFVVAYGYN